MSSEFPPESLAFHFSLMVDPRMDRTKAHSLSDVLVVAVCAILCGAEGFVDFEDYGNAQLAWLKTLLLLPNGIPSHDTFRRVFALLDPKEFSECFRRWTEGLRKEVPGEIVAIDGKTSRRSHDRAYDKGPIHTVSAWGRENGLVLGQIKVDEKSNEITAIPELLRGLKLAGCIVTIDAMGAQTKIATEVVQAKADYVLALKGNQSALQQEVVSFIEATHENPDAKVSYDHEETIERGHGRVDTRRYWITENVEWLTKHSQWQGLRSIGMVESTREIQGKITTERRHFLCSIAADAELFARAVRGHWAIENSLHWCLDVVFREDECRIREGYAAANLATLRHMAINVLKSDTIKKRPSIKGKRKIAGWDSNYLRELLRF